MLDPDCQFMSLLLGKERKGRKERKERQDQERIAENKKERARAAENNGNSKGKEQTRDSTSHHHCSLFVDGCPVKHTLHLIWYFTRRGGHITRCLIAIVIQGREEI
jgi:hypothetical protein